MTSYPDNVVARFEEAFEEANPAFDMQVLWRNADDTLAWLDQDGHAPVDVYWTPSPRTFTTLKAQGRLQPLSALQRGLPATLGATVLSDPDGYYVASEVAGFGFAVDQQGLKERGLAVPTDWADLTDPRYAGLIALPVPSAVGFAPPMIDIVLQAYGWERGWAVWSEIAGNANLIRRGATLVSDEVASGRNLIGLSIDFFVAAAIASGTEIDFVYPTHGGLNPAHIALFTESTNAQAANAFIDFILSHEGQALLADPDIRKLPVRPDAYDALPAAYHNPFVAAAQGAYDFDNALSQSRIAVLNAAFEQMLMQPHDSLRELWARVHGAQAQGKDMSQAVALLGTPVLTEAQAADPAWQALFAARPSGMRAGEAADVPMTQAMAIEAQWRQGVEQRFAEVASLLQAAGA